MPILKITVAISSVVLLLSGCSSSSPAPIERKERVYYGRDGLYNQSSQDRASNLPYDLQQEKLESTITEETVKPPVEESNKEEIKKDVYEEPSLTELEQELETFNKASHFKYPYPLNSNNFIWPLEGKVLARYGGSTDQFSEGIVIEAPMNSMIAAAGDGEVMYVGNNLEDYGKLVILKHDNDIFSAYANCASILVQKGEIVKKSQPIARVGKTGGVKTPRLHFSMRKGKTTVNPELPLMR